MASIYKSSAYILIYLLSLISIFHILVLAQVIPYKIVWGGRLKSEIEMYRFESVSLFLNIIMLGVVLIKKEIIQTRISPKLITLSLWMMCLLFLMNTLGNLTAVDPFEKLVFTPITLLLSIASLFLALDRKSNKAPKI